MNLILFIIEVILVASFFFSDEEIGFTFKRIVQMSGILGIVLFTLIWR